MALLNKEIDILQYFPPKYVDRHKSEYSKKGIILQEVTGLSWYQIFLGVTKPVVSNQKFRQACAYAIDLDVVTQAAYKGYAKVNPSVLPEQSQYWTPYHKTWYKKDVNKARQLLKEAGYKGEEVILDTTKKYASMYSQAVAVQSELVAVGINVKLNVIDWPVLLQKNVAGDFQMMSYGFGPMPNPGLAYSHLQRTKFDQVYPRIKEIWEESMRTSDLKALQKLFEEAHKIQVAQVPWIQLYNYNYLQAHHDYVKEYKTINIGYPRLWGVWLNK
jgi:peptide/nickel transport system substrate-binding protein